ncbi:aldehyde dehydrogenase (NAD(P)(+)) ald5 [Fusarium solani]|nr:aldehyde dehydrogenase (NAD(P)(+)) ald5 [Fusarium solani]
MGYIEDGKAAGAKVVTGGNRLGSKGFYIEPTIFSDVTGDMSIVQEEIFGPVCTVQKFDNEEEAIRLANDTPYGLAAAVHTSDVNTSVRVSSAIRAGTVWVNSYNLLSTQAPFGGFKQSGIGRELGSYALDNYTQIKTVKVYTGKSLF